MALKDDHTCEVHKNVHITIGSINTNLISRNKFQTHSRFFKIN